jgi:hypothetical protein
MTTNRPFAVMSPAKEFTGLVAETRVELVTWVTKGSGVELAGACAEVSAPAISIHAAAAHKKAITSLIIKNMNERSKFSPGPTESW